MFDSHVHYDYPDFFDNLEAVAERARAAGVAGAMNPAVDVDSSLKALEIHGRCPWILPALGVHPLYVDRYDRIPEEELLALAQGGSFFAVGETGLDWWHGRENEKKQFAFFEFQAGLAQKFGLPLLLHLRKSFYEAFGLLKSAGFRGQGVVHAFSGSWEMARKALDEGFYISASANITRPNKTGLREALARVPLERLLVETDAPDIPPYARKGEIHQPWQLPETLAALSAVMGVEAGELSRITEENAERLFKVKVRP